MKGVFLSTPTIESIISEYHPLFLSIVKRFFLNKDDAQDALQEIYLTINAKLHTFNGDSKLSTWLYTLSYRKCLELSKNEKTLTTEWLHDYFSSWEEVDSPAEEFEKKSWVNENCNRCLTGIFHCLDNDARLLYILREIVELSYKELADICDTSSANLRKTVSRAKDKLNNFMNDECYLFNKEGSCQCRMKSFLGDLENANTIDSLRHSVQNINTYLNSKDSWDKEVLEKIAI